MPTLSGLLIHHVPRTQLNACWEAPKTPWGVRGAARTLGPQQCPPGRASLLASDVCPAKAGNFSQGAPGENGAVCG